MGWLPYSLSTPRMHHCLHIHTRYDKASSSHPLETLGVFLQPIVSGLLSKHLFHQYWAWYTLHVYCNEYFKYLILYMFIKILIIYEGFSMKLYLVV